jgi:phospholipid transport system substrate-binding protein
MTRNTPNISQIHRRGLLGLAIIAAVATAPWASAGAAVGDTAPAAPIERLNAALLTSMKSAAQSSMEERYRTLTPVIERVFNLPTVLAASVGLAWARMPEAKKAQLEAAFHRYTISSYVSNFDSYNGQSFEILPPARQLPSGDVVVQTRLNRANASPIRLDYVMHQGPAGWQVVDVLTDGAISRVAVQRSDFRSLLMSGGVAALTAELSRKTANLTGSMG